MDFFLLFGSLLLVSFTILIPLISLTFYTHKTKISQPNLPPGKMGIPVIGESLEFLSTARKGHPEKFINDRIAKYSSQVFKTSILGQPTTVLCGASGNKFLFSNENKLVVSWWPDSINKLLSSSAENSSIEESKKLRKLLPSFLKPGALQGYIATMDIIAQRHLKSCWEGKPQVVVFPLTKMYTFLVACKVFLSIEDPHHVAKLIKPFNDLVSGAFSMPINLPGTAFNRAMKASKLIRRELLAIIKQRKIDLSEDKASNKQDILSHMLLTTDEDGKIMEEKEIANKILGLLIGGHDTASAAITFVVKFLAELHHIYNEVFKEQMEIAKSKKAGELLHWDDIQKMKYSWNVACEALRLAPPLQGSFRQAVNDFPFAGLSIPKGWKLYWSAIATHKNPEYFPSPETFDPSRFEGNGPAPYTFVPFGGGPRMCPGKEYARLEMLVFIHNLVKRFKWDKLIPDENIIADPIPMPAQNLPIRLFQLNDT